MTKRKIQQHNLAPTGLMADTTALGWVADYQSIGFMGYRLDRETGCYHLGNGYRLFNPQMRAFYSPDSLSPFGAGGINRYEYCNLDPINRKDPTGHAAFAIISLVLTAISAGLTISAFGVNLAAWKYSKTDPEYAEKLLKIGIGLNIAAAITGLAGGGFGFAAAGRATVARSAGTYARTVGSAIRNLPARGAASLNYQSGLPNLLGAISLKFANLQPMVKVGFIVGAIPAVFAGLAGSYLHHKASRASLDAARQPEPVSLPTRETPPFVSSSSPPSLRRQSWARGG